MAKKTKEKDLHDSFYDKPAIKKPFWIFLILFFFFLGILNNLQVKNIISNKITALIIKNSPCQFYFPSPKVSFFPLPEILFEKIGVPSTCTDLYQDLVLNNLSIQFWGPGIFPFGAKTRIKLTFNDNIIESNLVFSFSSFFLFLDESEISLKNISTVIPNAPKLSGNIKVNTEIKMNYKGNLELLNANIISNNLSIPPQNISNFDLPALPLSILKVDIEQETMNSLNIKEFKLGDPASSPIAANFSGKVQLAKAALPYSNLDLKGSLKLTDSLTNTLPLLKLLLKKYPLVGDSYQMKIGGTLSMPMPSPAK